ncbi:MAG: DNA repair protein RadC [Acidobacteriota bacterium]|jgi:DNA repair protein RadC
MKQSAIGIKEWPAGERPRERCLAQGPSVLSTTELMAILFRTGTRGKTALDLARETLASRGTLRGLSSLSPQELARIAGIGRARAAQLAAAMELASRLADEEVRLAETLSGAQDAYRFLKPRLRDLPHEVFAVIFLNQKHGVLAYRELFRGTVNASSVHPREVIKEVLKENAAAVIFAHNHPSGFTSPSPDDIRLTEDLVALLRHLDVRVLDHLVVGGNGYFSFAREGLLS